MDKKYECAYCDKKAVMICGMEDDFLCKSCAGEDDFLLPLVNSPRTGVCGYVG